MSLICRGCNKQAFWTRSGPGWEVCNNCSDAGVPSVRVVPGPTKGKLIKENPQAVNYRGEKGRDQIVNQMVKLNNGQVGEFQVTSRDSKGNLVKESFDGSKGNVTDRQVIKRKDGRRVLTKKSA